MTPLDRIRRLCEQLAEPGDFPFIEDVANAVGLLPLLLEVVDGYVSGYPEIQPPDSLRDLLDFAAEHLPEAGE
ncbi:MAG: hypothetical protein M0R37_12740 [Bacteroidales bacterium]|nr:hypothetical protein [Bacteroidales bacterium]